MARVKIREYHAKQLVVENIKKKGFDVNVKSVLVTPESNLETLPQEHPWVQTTQLVVKPDQLFGQRKKHGLVAVNVSWDEARTWIAEHRHKEVTIQQATDELTHFLIEPFIPHEQEYYLAFTSERDNDIIYFSGQGGVDIEENWDNVTKINVPTLGSIDDIELPQVSSVIKSFIKELFTVFRELDFSYLEINPFTVNGTTIHMLDTVAHVDDCASFKNMQVWRELELPREFGKKSFPEEEIIDEINRRSGSAIKLTMLNPQGEIWTIFAGGGASMIFLDMITNLGKGAQIANYSDISGNTRDESYNYAKTILELMTRNNGKVLIIGGVIANFTDIKETFGGFADAIEEYGSKLQEKGISIYVRRGGPNYEAGLKRIKEACESVGLKNEVHGPETSMPKIIKIAGAAL